MEINHYIFFSIAGLINLFMLILIYFSKERLHTKENDVYKALMWLTVIGAITEIVMVFGVPLLESHYIIKETVAKFFLVTCELWICLLATYTMIVSNKISSANEKVIRITYFIFLSIFFVCVMLTCCLPIEYAYNSTHTSWMYTYGMSTKMVFVTAIIFLTISIFYVLKNKKRYKDKRFVPIYVYIVLSSIVSLLQQLDPSALLITFTETLIIILMYFTIENPDMKMLNEMELAKLQAEKANMAKTDFLSSMSHEIRTPLNAIVGFSSMIETEDTIEGCKENARDIVLASQTLLDIVNGILDISKIEANKMEIVNKNYNLLPELYNLTKLMISRIGEKPIEFKTDFAPDIPFEMYGDIGKIKQVVTNILTNACKYTEKGEIVFSAKCVNEKDTCSLMISVRDTGRGIKKDQMDKLFTKFNRLDEDKNTTIEGTGLGLAITKKLVDMMGGRIAVQSVYGQGSQFAIFIKQKIVKMEGNLEEVLKKDEVLNLEGRRILVVDDNEMNLRVADKLLKTHHLSTKLVKSGTECIDLIKNNEKFDLILMDDMMPHLKGPEVLNLLKQIPNFNIPTIALTANATEGIRESYINMGFDDYLAKPIEKPELVRILKKFLSNGENVTVHDTGVEVKKVAVSDSKSDNAGTNVLIVDDNFLNIKVAVKVLEPYHFNVSYVLSGKECLEKVKTNEYDLIFMDYMMPEMDGIETLQHLKENPSFKIPVVVLTADATDGAEEKFLTAGFDEYIAKPLTKDVLNDIIERRLHKETVVDEDVKKEAPIDKVAYLKENGVDVDHGLELLGDMDMYNETLKIFAEGASERFNKIKAYKESGDMPNYAIEVHGLKSDCKYLGFMHLADISYEHELKSKANDIEFVNSHYDELITESKKIFDIVKKYFN